MRFFGFAFLALLVLLAVSFGCGRSDRPALGKVSGTVTYKGQPVKSGNLVFEVGGARPANAKIVDGKITEVSTFNSNDGVPVGSARIAVFATESGGASTPAAPAANDPGTYQVPAANYMDVGARRLIPDRYNNPATSGLIWEIKQGENTVTLQLVD
ncbi:MAG: hypothetical protein NTY19_02740 [Planctomycetota bacterium]|nr:hypothetical protein [Planctomycetota bacterium]